MPSCPIYPSRSLVGSTSEIFNRDKQGTTHLAVSEQFHYTTLVGSIASNLSDDRVNESALGRANALSVTGLCGTGDGGGGVALVRSGGEVYRRDDIVSGGELE